MHHEGVCRPVCFVAYDSTLLWRIGENVIESSFETVLSTREASRRYRTAISTELRRRDGTSHREINAWLNRKLGISSVERVTLAELERSIGLLVRTLVSKR